MLKKLHQTDIKVIRCIAKGTFSSLEDLQHMLAHEMSEYSSKSHIEGIYLRVDNEEVLSRRAKLVRSGFVQVVH